MKFKLKNTNLFLMKGNPHMLHITTIAYGLREFVVMLERNTAKMYIEEAVLVTEDFSDDVFANMKFIDDDLLATELAAFADEKGLRDMKKIAEVCIAMGHPEWTHPPAL